RFHTLILPNHGAITRGNSIQEAIFLMLLLEGMASRHLAVHNAARATGLAPRPIPAEVALATKKELNALAALPLIWEEHLTRLQVRIHSWINLRPANRRDKFSRRE